ncbi:MAG: PAS domain S-box protein [Deltaproteobacteria bacterium]|nr:PAS domain S-box protein [Deltaproteobacteria bacterium]
MRFSRSLDNMLGVSSAEVCGAHFASLLSENMRAEAQSLLDTVRKSGAVIGRKTEFLTKLGKTVGLYISVYPLRDSSGSLYSYVVRVSAKKTEAHPAILTNEFQKLFRFSNDAVVVTDREGNIIDANPAFLDAYGYNKDEVLGKNPRFLKSGHFTKEQYQRMWADILDPDRGYWEGEIINKRKDGSEAPVILSINAIKDPKGEIRNFLGIAFDMTRQKELDKLKKMYIDHIIHDIRGPLTSIMANSELILMRLVQQGMEKDRKRLDAIIESAQRIDKLTEDMLNFIRKQGD